MPAGPPAATPASAALRWIDVRPGEGGLFALLFCYQFLIIFSYGILKPVRSSLLVSDLGADSLSTVYLATALIVGVAVAIYQWFVARLDRHDLVTRVILFFTTNLLVFWWCLPGGSPTWSGVLYVWCDIFSMTIVSMGWAYANDLMTPEQGKRLFGPISTGAAVGGILGSAFASEMARTMGTVNLLGASAFVLAPCALVPVMVRRLGTALSPSGRGPESGPAPSPLEGLKLLATTPYLQGILCLMGTMVVVSLLIEYQFSKAVELGFSSTDDRTVFLGRMLYWVNSINLITQFFLLGRMVRRLGIGAVLLIHPLVTIITSSTYFVWTGLSVMWWVKMLDWTVKYGLNKTTMEMLYLPTSAEAKYKAKAFIDIFFYRVMKAVVAAILFAGAAWGLDVRGYSVLIVGLSGLWILVAVGVARGYRRMVRRRIGDLIDLRYPGKDLSGLPARPEGDDPGSWAMEPVLADAYAAFLADPGSGPDRSALSMEPARFEPMFELLARRSSDPTYRACLGILLDGQKGDEALVREFLEIHIAHGEARWLLPLLGPGLTREQASAALETLRRPAMHPKPG